MNCCGEEWRRLMARSWRYSRCAVAAFRLSAGPAVDQGSADSWAQDGFAGACHRAAPGRGRRIQGREDEASNFPGHVRHGHCAGQGSPGVCRFAPLISRRRKRWTLRMVRMPRPAWPSGYRRAVVETCNWTGSGAVLSRCPAKFNIILQIFKIVLDPPNSEPIMRLLSACSLSRQDCSPENISEIFPDNVLTVFHQLIYNGRPA